MIDLQQIAFMLRNCTDRSLLLIDEFGKGTNASDGAGLFVGLVKQLVTMGPNLPKTLMATHFHEIFMNDFLKSRLPIGLAHMELVLTKRVKRGEEEEVENPSSMGVGMNAPAPKEEDVGIVIGVTPMFK